MLDKGSAAGITHFTLKSQEGSRVLSQSGTEWAFSKCFAITVMDYGAKSTLLLPTSLGLCLSPFGSPVLCAYLGPSVFIIFVVFVNASIKTAQIDKWTCERSTGSEDEVCCGRSCHGYIKTNARSGWEVTRLGYSAACSHWGFWTHKKTLLEKRRRSVSKQLKTQTNKGNKAVRKTHYCDTYWFVCPLTSFSGQCSSFAACSSAEAVNHSDLVWPKQTLSWRSGSECARSRTHRDRWAHKLSWRWSDIAGDSLLLFLDAPPTWFLSFQSLIV